MQTYKNQVDGLREQLAKARGSLARDVAAAVATADWHKFLRDKYDVAALVQRVAEFGQQKEWVAALQAAGDRARQQGTKRGRPRKGNKGNKVAASQATMPAAVAAGEPG
jgi:hypothetical protein